jgi:hypothetical protein
MKKCDFAKKCFWGLFRRPTVLAYLFFGRVLSLFCVLLPMQAISAELPGQAIIQQYKGEKPYPAPDANVGKALSIQFASGYLSGLIDSYEGDKWCNTHSVVAGELKAYVQDYIEKLPAPQRGRPIRQLIGEALKKRYPCH